jgi:Protein of unknown function (DUF1194)
MRYLPRPWLAAVLGGLVLFARPAFADAVDVALVLAADVSRSIDAGEFELQRKGYAAAITSPKVLTAIQAGTHGAIALCFVEWSGPDEQATVGKWTVIRDGETAQEFAATLLEAPRSFTGRTSISAGIDYAMAQLAHSGVEADQRIIDVSGDGTNNAGRPVTDARDEAVAKGVTINGLAIINQRPEGYFFAHTQPPGGLPNYYKNNVIGGEAAFLLVVKDFTTFGEAMTDKLLNEIALAAPLGSQAMR